VGGNDQLIFDGYSAFLNKEGELCALGAGFQEDELLIDLNAKPVPCALPSDERGDLYRALVLGVRDYFAKQGFQKACIGISGGIDSALVACIAVEALGKENVLGVAMPSRYNTASSLKDAELLAQHLGIALNVISIEEPFQAYLDLLAPSFAGKGPDITEENLQSRIRGAILMALSNKHQMLVLSTGNKSELALGYCTLYGDMVGGLSVISDVTKKQVYALASWINRQEEIIPRSIMEKEPSAELRPNQKDSDTLPEYPAIDAVLQDYLEECLSPEQIAKKRKLSLSLVQDIIQRIHRSEYKRRQAAPGLRVTRRSFQVGRHYPIVQKWI
jgi:NAD+ synthase (glutamine-hydrolysing)